MNRRNSLASLLAMVVAVLAAFFPAQQAVAQDGPGSIVGAVSSGRQAVARALVVLSTADGEVARTATNAEGRFEFPRVRPGRYLVRASKDGVGTGEAAAAVTSGQATRVHIALEDRRPGSLAGGVFNADGPVAEATVVIQGRRGDVARTTTGPDGRFGVRQLAPGAYTVLAFKDGVGRGMARVEITPGAVTTTRIELRRADAETGAIAGVVRNADGPVADAVVILHNARGEVARTVSNADGVYGFRNIRVGDYLVTAAKRGVGEGSARTHVTADTVTRTPVELVAPPRAGAINGHVGNSAGVVAGADVVLSFNGQAIARTITARDGSFSFPNLRPGQYAVAAFKRGVGEGRTQADVTAGQTTTVRVILQ